MSANAHGVGSFSMPLARVYRVVGENFPGIVSETIGCLSVAATLLLEDQQNPVALNLEGVPTSLKTTLVDLFGGADDKVTAPTSSRRSRSSRTPPRSRARS